MSRPDSSTSVFAAGLCVLALALVLSLGAWAPARADAAGDALFAPFDALYLAAVLDAQATLAHAKAPPPAPDIRDISPDNPALVWSGEPGESRVLVTLFTRSSYYSAFAPGDVFPAAVDLWVLPAPQLRDGVKAGNPLGASLSPGLAASQYLGLPPRNANDAVVSLWVAPSDMLRPAIDPRIDTHELETSFFVTLQTVPLTPAPVLPGNPGCAGCPPAASYAAWFLGRQASIFRLDAGYTPYPWTGLGYTYDWTPGAPDVVGGSEFIVRAGSPVVFQDMTPAGDYFR
ncbi:MAG: hypothetical protein ACOZEN_12945 [Thermodesulfobacteriota bacterium]